MFYPDHLIHRSSPHVVSAVAFFWSCRRPRCAFTACCFETSRWHRHRQRNEFCWLATWPNRVDMDRWSVGLESKVAPGKDHEEEDMRAEIMRESGQLFLQILFTNLVHPKFLQQQLGTETSQAEPRRSVHWQFLRSRAEETVLCDRGGLQGLGSSATIVSYHTRSNYIELWLTKAAEI